MAEVFRDEQHLYSQAVAPGSINVVPAGIRPRAVHDGPWQIGHIYLPRDVVDMLCEQIELESRVVEIVDQGCHPHRSMVDVFEQCISEMRDEDLLSRLKIDGLGLEVALRMLQGFCNVGDRVSFSVLRPARGGLAPWQERRCCEYLRAHLAEDVSLAELAGIANLSPFHFARMFKRTVGVPPHAYQRRLRAERAQELLLATDFSIGDIAAAVGYETPQAFARMFRAETGASPSDWRRERRA
jgi:AraC family transcriptional regulator